MKNSRWSLPLLVVLMASLAEGEEAGDAVKRELAGSETELQTAEEQAEVAGEEEGEGGKREEMWTEMAVLDWSEGEDKRRAGAEEAGEAAMDEEWLGTVWTQVDEMVRPKAFWLQPMLTTSGVRGGEAEDRILGKLYYKGNPAEPSSD